MSMIRRAERKIKKAFGSILIKRPVPYPILCGEFLVGRVALVTGGSSGIGLAIAQSFIRNGASVVICGRDMSKLQKASETLTKQCGDGQYVRSLQLDVADTRNIEACLESFLKTMPDNVDILVNNAGTGQGDTLGKTTIRDFETTIKTNLEGAYFMSQYFYKYMKTKGIRGNILNIASSSSLRPANSPYTISKWGILGLTKGLAKMAIKHGIVVNGLAPGPTATAMLDKMNANNINSQSNPSGRLALPEEIANLSVVLVSGLGKLVVGDTLFATGGAAVLTYDDVGY